MKNTNVFRLFGIIAFVVIIVFSMTACDLQDKEEETSLEGYYGDRFGRFKFSGDNFEYTSNLRSERKGTFSNNKSEITFYSTHENKFITYPNGGGSWNWVPLTSTSAPCGSPVEFLDSGSPVNYKFERAKDGKITGLTIGNKSYGKN